MRPEPGMGLLIVLSVIIAGCSASAELGQQTERSIAVSGCHGFEAAGSYDLQLAHGDSAVVHLSGPELWVDKFEVSDDDTLALKSPELDIQDDRLAVRVECPDWGDIMLTGQVQAQAAQGLLAPVKETRRLALYGQSRLTAESVGADELDLRASGQAQLEVASLTSDVVKTSLSGQAQLRAAGSSSTLKITATGQAQLRGFDLTAQRVDVDVTGQSAVEITATAHLAGSVRGQSQVHYRGAAEMAIERQGKSSVTHAQDS